MWVEVPGGYREKQLLFLVPTMEGRIGPEMEIGFIFTLTAQANPTRFGRSPLSEVPQFRSPETVAFSRRNLPIDALFTSPNLKCRVFLEDTAPGWRRNSRL